MAQKHKEKESVEGLRLSGSLIITYDIDIVERALEIFDKVILAIAHDISDGSKRSLFTVEERIEIAKNVFEHSPNLIVDSFKGLLVDYVGRTNARVILRGLRATSDFEYEFHMASMNRSLNTHLDTLFMMTSKDYFCLLQIHQRGGWPGWGRGGAGSKHRREAPQREIQPSPDQRESDWLGILKISSLSFPHPPVA
jgi:pantetheine-phosphate adenylyltransferase